MCIVPSTAVCLHMYVLAIVYIRYKMFVAKGREFKFFGDGFKCPECGAGKNKFVEGDMDD